MTLDNTNSKVKYTFYVCEGDVEGGMKVTPTNDSKEALDIALASKEKIHFISTANPLSEEQDDEV